MAYVNTEIIINKDQAGQHPEESCQVRVAFQDENEINHDYTISLIDLREMLCDGISALATLGDPVGKKLVETINQMNQSDE